MHPRQVNLCTVITRGLHPSMGIEKAHKTHATYKVQADYSLPLTRTMASYHHLSKSRRTKAENQQSKTKQNTLQTLLPHLPKMHLTNDMDLWPLVIKIHLWWPANKCKRPCQGNLPNSSGIVVAKGSATLQSQDFEQKMRRETDKCAMHLWYLFPLTTLKEER